MGFVVASSSETGGVQSSPWLIEDGGAPSGAGITCGVIFGRLSLGNRPGKNFVDSVATNSAPVSSQKGMLNLQISGQKVNFQLAFFGRWHFRFEVAWLLEDSCDKEVQSLWEQSSGMVPDRLHWALCEEDPTYDILGEVVDAKLALNLEYDRSELYWEQRARKNWLQYGDRNTAFFPPECYEKKPALWFSCNKHLNEGIAQAKDEVVTFIKSYCLEFSTVCSKLKNSCAAVSVKWQPPPLEVVKAKFDTTFKPASGDATSGVVVRNSSSDIMGVGFRRFGHVPSSFAAEASTSIHAIEVGNQATHHLASAGFDVDDSPPSLVSILAAERRDMEPS
ncbi:hypothetical protein V6N11_066323 [Hibiscus sabdariffa]|uniref:Uncharacterized protein n=1 Tax=Hibiscus sabdariffa TaxID=183260 RepID=A0ABR2A955_9ROSI